MKHQKLTLTLFILVAFSCNKNDRNYIYQNYESLKSLRLDEIVSFESYKGSKERLYDNTFRLGEDYYPNNLKFKIANPRIFERKDKNLNLESDYFYNSKDSLVKTILYMWRNNNSSKDALVSETANFKTLKKKYIELKKQLTHKLGKSSNPSLKPGCYLSLVSYCLWENKNMKAYLAIHREEIRLVIYSE